MQQRHALDDLLARSQAAIVRGQHLHRASQTRLEQLRMLRKGITGPCGGLDQRGDHDGIPYQIRATARTLTTAAQTIVRLHQQQPMPSEWQALVSRQLQRRMRAFQHAVNRSLRAHTIYAFDDDGQCGTDGQLAELASRVNFIVHSIGAARIPPERLSAYVHGLIADVEDLLEYMVIDPAPIPKPMI